MAETEQVRKRSLTIAGHRTSVSLEEPFWHHLRASARRRGMSLSSLVAEIDRTRSGNLSSALRLHVLRSLEARAPEDSAGADD